MENSRTIQMRLLIPSENLGALGVLAVDKK